MQVGFRSRIFVSFDAVRSPSVLTENVDDHPLAKDEENSLYIHAAMYSLLALIGAFGYDPTHPYSIDTHHRSAVFLEP